MVTYSVTPTLQDAINSLQKRGASVHYIIDTDGKQYQYHNDLTDKSFCCGPSNWKGNGSVNGFGINIMFINDARKTADEYSNPLNPREGFKEQFQDYTRAQIEQAKLCLKDICERYPGIDIKHDLVSLGEVATRHIAPGPKFFWKELADSGFGQFVETTESQRENVLIKKGLEDEICISKVQEQLKTHGYNITKSGCYDDATKTWFYKFNVRYVPDQYPPNEWSEASQISLDAQDIGISGDISHVIVESECA